MTKRLKVLALKQIGEFLSIQSSVLIWLGLWVDGFVLGMEGGREKI